jgi:hypothetical protein
MSLFLPVHQPAHPILTLTVSVNNEGQITPHAKAEHKGHVVESPVIGDAQQVWAINLPVPTTSTKRRRRRSVSGQRLQQGSQQLP